MSVSDILGIPRDFVFKGEVYKVCKRDLTIEVLFADWCKAEAALALSRLRPKVTAEFYAEQMKLYNGRIISKQMEWDNDDVYLASWSKLGQRHLLWLKIKRGEALGGAPIERDQVDDIAADPEKWAELADILMEQDYAPPGEPKKPAEGTSSATPTAASSRPETPSL